jgi:hypothetical protein
MLFLRWGFNISETRTGNIQSNCQYHDTVTDGQADDWVGCEIFSPRPPFSPHLLPPIRSNPTSSLLLLIPHNFIAPSPPFRDDQAVDAHSTRAPAIPLQDNAFHSSPLAGFTSFNLDCTLTHKQPLPNTVTDLTPPFNCSVTRPWSRVAGVAGRSRGMRRNTFRALLESRTRARPSSAWRMRPTVI